MIFSCFMRSNYAKSLMALCITLQISGCAGGGDGSGSGTVTVNWTAPDTRSNGDQLSLAEIGGYRIYYGATAGDYPNQLDINDSTAEQTTFTVPSGVYYFVMTTYDVDGRESSFSIENTIAI